MMSFPSTLPPFDADPRDRAGTWAERVSGVDDLLRMWAHPSMVAWFTAGVVMLVLARIPFQSFSFIPGCVEFHPGFALVPFLGAAWGPAGCWAALVSSLVSDRWVGLAEGMEWGRAAGMFLAARCGQRLLTPGLKKAMGPLGLLDGLRAVPSAGALALCTGWAAGFLHFYPMVHLLTLTLANNLFFLAVFLPALSPAIRRRYGGDAPTWTSVLTRAGGWATHGVARCLIWAGGAGGCAVLILTSGWAESLWPWSLYLVGVRTGLGMTALGGLCVGLVVAGVFWPVGRTAGARTAA